MKKFVCSLMMISLMAPSVTLAFSDLSNDHPYYSALIHLQEEGIIQGYEDNTVRPDAEINRAELIKILVEGLDHKPDPEVDRDCFPDVGNEWFAKYVCYAQKKNWVEGYPDGNFYPAQNVNRAESLKIILNAFEFVVVPPNEAPFMDVDKSFWFAPFVSLAKEKNLIPETGEKFESSKLRTRGEIAEIISRILNINEVKDDKFEDWPDEWVDAEMKTLELINKLRAEDGKEPLVINPFLTKVAREHSKDMAENIGKLSHDSSDGRKAHERITNSGYDFLGASGENIGSGTVGANRSIYEAIEDVHLEIFMKEPDTGFNHKTTLLSRSFPFSQIGIGVYEKDGVMYFTTDFISIQE